MVAISALCRRARDHRLNTRPPDKRCGLNPELPHYRRTRTSRFSAMFKQHPGTGTPLGIVL